MSWLLREGAEKVRKEAYKMGRIYCMPHMFHVSANIIIITSSSIIHDFFGDLEKRWQRTGTYLRLLCEWPMTSSTI